jgi:glycosyltransferase involved in cell wall biosynthesis
VRIVHLTWGLGVGGAEAMLSDIAGAQAATHRIWIIVVNRDVDASIAQGIASRVRLVTLRRPRGSANPWYLAKLIFQLWRIRPDVVHVHQESFGRIRKWLPAPTVLTVHNTRLALGDTAAFDSICCISEAVRDDVMARFPSAHPRVIHNGIRFDAVRLKETYGTNPFRMVQVSRLAHEQKGQDVLIRALRLLLDRLGEDSAGVDFIGTGESLDYLRRLAIECGVEKHCRFLGALTRQSIYERLHEYDLLVQPSRYEGFGLTVIEGIAAELPVLVSGIEGPMEIIANGELGWYFKSEDPADLAAKIIDIAGLSRRADFGGLMRARLERARARFDIEVTAHSYLNEYARIV